ncbi:MAG TPA: hypothetical protein VGF48_18695 [Thermoanaerobaculia bacterium]|jgi:hypothetical protein
MRYVEPGAEAAQNARIALHGQWAKVYELAFELSPFDQTDPAEAFPWVEKWKGRAFAVTLGVRLLPVPSGIPEQILSAERNAIEALTNAVTFEEIAGARDRLLEAWALLAASRKQPSTSTCAKGARFPSPLSPSCSHMRNCASLSTSFAKFGHAACGRRLSLSR